jgi:hypothetical protein
MSMAPGLGIDGIENREGLFIEANGEPFNRFRFRSNQALRTGENGCDLLARHE